MEMPKYMFSKRFLTTSVLVIFLFSIPFLLIYKPFSATVWLGFQSLRSFLFTILFFAIVISLMAISKIIMYRFQSKHVLTVGRFIAWAGTEFLVIALTYILLTASATGDTTPVSISLILKASLCVGLIIAIPYGYLSLAAYNRAIREEFEAFKASISDNRKESTVMLSDYKGDPALTLKIDSIYYMEAQDNYVRIHYKSEGVVHSYMLRCPTQKLESMIEGTSLIRCHRSYIVNMSHITEFIRGHKSATIVLGELERKEISVSKSYYKQTLLHLREANPSYENIIKRT